MGKIVDLTSETWDAEVMKASEPVMVDFWAEWCGPCKMIAPVIEELAQEYDGQLKVCKLNTDNSPDISSQFQIMGIPSLLFFKDGEVIDKVVGAASKKQFKEKIDLVLSK